MSTSDWNNIPDVRKPWTNTNELPECMENNLNSPCSNDIYQEEYYYVPDQEQKIFWYCGRHLKRMLFAGQDILLFTFNWKMKRLYLKQPEHQ